MRWFQGDVRVSSRKATGFGVVVAVVVATGLAASFTGSTGPPDDRDERSSVVSVTPTRILDTRSGIGLAGPFVSATPRHLQVTGPIPTVSGEQHLVPFGATGVTLNVTVVEPQARGFLSIRPGDASGAPTTSSLNFEAGAVLANAVQVRLPVWVMDGSGVIEITYDAYGTPGPTTDVLIDVVGYTVESVLRSYSFVETSDVPPGESLTSELRCAEDGVATGGGFRSRSSDLAVMENFPDGTGWTVTAHNDGTEVATIDTYVRCVIL